MGMSKHSECKALETLGVVADLTLFCKVDQGQAEAGVGPDRCSPTQKRSLPLARYFLFNILGFCPHRS